MIDFKAALMSDLTGPYGYTEEEAKAIYEDVGEDFIEEMISDLWNNWSESFPVGVKDE